MHEQTGRADQGEQNETNGQPVAGQLGKQQAEVFEDDQAVQFRLAMLARAKREGQLDDPQGLFARGHDVEQDLEAVRR